MIKTVGLRTEILITLTLLLGAALFLGGIMMLRLMEKSLLEERVGQLESLSNILAQSLVMNANDMSLLTRLPDNLNYVNWRVYDEDLNTINSYVAEGISPFSSSRRQMAKLSADPQRKVHFPTLLNLFDQSEPSVHFLLPIRAQTRFYGLLELSFSLADIRFNLLESLKVIVIYVFLYGLVLIIAGYYLLQRNIVNPARNLLKATKNVSCGNLETRLPIAGPTEFRELAGAYNQMVEALQTSRGETEIQIASLEETNRELQCARAELFRSEKLASVGQLAAGLAHELGNPLAALIGYLEILKQKIEAGSDKDIIERSLIETNRIDFLVRELLDFSRPSDDAQIEVVDLIVALNSSVQLLNNQGALANIEIIDILPKALPPVSIDPNKLQQVLINLLLNASQSCVKKGKITLSSGSDEASVWLAIRDNGRGIASADLNKIFDPFFTTKSTGKGTGLGLSICQRIVEEAGGVIQVESSLGEGSSFKVIFIKES